jgi:hypothetical protein
MKNKIVKLSELSLIFFILFSLPFVFNCLIAGGAYKNVMAFAVFLGLIFFFIPYSLNSQKIFSMDILLVFFLKIAVLSILMIIHSDKKYFDEILITLSSIVTVGVAYQIGIKKASLLILRFALIMSVLSIIGFFLILFGILAPFSSFPNPDTRLNQNFLLTFSNAYYRIGNILVIRPAG